MTLYSAHYYTHGKSWCLDFNSGHCVSSKECLSEFLRIIEGEYGKAHAAGCNEVQIVNIENPEDCSGTICVWKLVNNAWEVKSPDTPAEIEEL